MFTVRQFLLAVSLFALAILAGCTPYFGAPPPQEHRGGFTVLVDVPGQPASARVIADIGTFAQQRGFIRQSAASAPNAGPERYHSGKITLDIVNDSAHLRVNAYLHGFTHLLNSEYSEAFYQDFRQRYAGRYGDEGTITESDFSDDTGGPPRGGGHGGSGGRGPGGGR